MTIPVRMEIQANSHPAPSFSRTLPILMAADRNLEMPAELSIADLAFPVLPPSARIRTSAMC